MIDLSPYIVLVVEDSDVQRHHLVGLMHELHFGTVLQACDGQDALRVLDTLDGRPLYLLVTDVDMPGMDGIELITRLNAGHQVENLIVTSARDPRLLETVESMGTGNDCMNLLGTLPKPITVAGLARMLEHAQGRNHPCARLGAEEQTLKDIELALEAGQFVPFVQPKIEIATGRLKGVEILARWQHPAHGLLGPQHFIPAIEGSALMARFTLAMVEHSLRQLAAWRPLMPTLTVSINLSADDLADQGFVGRLMALVTAHEAPPASLIWEVTETMIMNKQALANLARLGLKGFGLSMDDFGIGYSSMQTLSRSPFTELKIDRIFVNGASERSNRLAILSSSLDMGKRLGVTTVAEGVETEADWQLLRQLGCDVAQGYLLAKPMPTSELLGWTRQHRKRLRELAQAPPAP